VINDNVMTWSSHRGKQGAYKNFTLLIYYYKDLFFGKNLLKTITKIWKSVNSNTHATELWII